MRREITTMDALFIGAIAAILTCGLLLFLANVFGWRP